jgi:pseudaminic acid synthase
MIIAELSANHAQQYEIAEQLVEAAHTAGADAVKVQTYTPDTITYRSDDPIFCIGEDSLWKGKQLWNLYNEAYTPWEWQPELKKRAESLGMQFIASVFDATSVDFWEEHGLETYKIASAELVDLPLIEMVASTGKKMIVSTGMGNLEEINDAVKTIEAAESNIDLTLLKCSSAYPASPESMHLQGIKTLAETFGYPVGLSDHTLTAESAIVAVGLGATCFEKHLKLDDSVKTPDSAFSLTPSAFAQWASQIRTATQSLGKADLGPSDAEHQTLPFRKSLFVVKDMAAGDLFTADTVKSIRPAHGIPPKYYKQVLQTRARCSIKAGSPLRFEHYLDTHNR